MLAICSITIARIFIGKSWRKQALLGAVVTVTSYVKANPVLVKRSRWDFDEGSKLAALVIAAGSLLIPHFVAGICVMATGPVCVPLAGSILAVVDVAIAAAIAFGTHGNVKHTKSNMITLMSILVMI